MYLETLTAGAIATRPSPAWATTRSSESDSVEHRRHIGDLHPAEDTHTLCIDIVQRDELDNTDHLHPGNPQVSLAGIRLNPDETRHLTRLLTTALHTIET